METRDYYSDELKSLTSDLYQDYQNLLHHYYSQYVDHKMKEGLSRRVVLAGMAEPRLVAERWHLYSALDRFKGVKKKGAGPLIKTAMEHQLVSSRHYFFGLLVVILKTLVFPVILFFILGITLLINPAIGTFFVSTVLVDTPELIILALVAFGLFILYVSTRYAFKFKDYFFEDMIDRAIANCNLKDFSKESYIKKESARQRRLSEKKNSIDLMIRE